MYNRRWAIIAGLGVIELWIIGLILRSISGGHAVPAPPALSASAAVSDVAARTIETGSAPDVTIDDENTTLTITARAGSAVSIDDHRQHHGWFRSDAAALHIERTSDGVRISRNAGVSFMMGSEDRRLDVVVPPDARLVVRNAGTTTISGLRASASLHSDDGSLLVSDHRGELHLTTDNGRIELTDVEAPYVEAASDDGRIMFDRVRADRVAVTTDNGRIEIGRSVLRGGKVQTDDGRVTLGLDPESDVTISAQTSSGKVIAESPLIVRGGSEDDDTPTMIRIGNGSGHLDVGSSDGSISIRTVGV